MPDEHRRPADGRLIAGRYRLRARLGRGGMGTVWQAEDELLHRLVAVKELHGVREGHSAGGQLGAADVASLREARAVARVKHPHVVVVHDVVEEDGAPYIVMELVDGPSLAERLKAGGPFEVPEAARIGLALLGALRAAHGFGVLHRDLKPANVLMEESTGRVVLTDFGIARLVEATSRTEAGSFVGSPEYTAPERMMGGDQAGPASDLWSLGALLCATLSGRSPFHRDSLAGVLHAVVEEEIRPPAAAEPLLRVVRGLLERDPARRLEAAEAERLLRAYLTDGAVPEDERPEPVADLPPAVPAAVPAAPEHVPTPEPERTPEPAPQPTPQPTPQLTPEAVPAPARRGHRARRVALVVAGALVVIAGATLGLAELRGAGIGTGTGTGTGTGKEAGPETAGGGPGAPTVRSPSLSPSPFPSQPPESVQASPPTAPATEASALPPAPAGYHTVSDPAGFLLAVPDGFVRSQDDLRVYYMSVDKAMRIGIRSHHPVPGGPTAAMHTSDVNGPESNPGYHDGSVTATTHNGYPAALWEFTWDGFNPAEGDRHTFDLCWDQQGRMYDVWVSAPVGRLDEARGEFNTALDSFEALR